MMKRKRIVKTYRGDGLPSRTVDYWDYYWDYSRNPFEIDMSAQGEFQVIQVYVEDPPGHWLEIATFYQPE